MGLDIQINDAALQAQITRLTSLKNDESFSLANYFSEKVDYILSVSSGDNADALREANAALSAAIDTFYLLLEKTYGFLTDASQAFAEKDLSLAAQTSGLGAPEA